MTLWSVHLYDRTVHTMGLGVINVPFFSEHFKSLENIGMSVNKKILLPKESQSMLLTKTFKLGETLKPGRFLNAT